MSDDEGMFTPFGFVPLRNPTEEEVAAYKERHKQNNALGNVTYENLPVFDPFRKCVKCGFQHNAEFPRQVSYIAEGKCAAELGDHEGLWAMCRRCDYGQFERTLDSR